MASQTPLATALSQISPTSSSISGPANGPITPKLINLCPANETGSLADLGLDNQTLLLMLPELGENLQPVGPGIWAMSPKNKSPIYIASLAPGDGFHNTDYQISPDHQWISFHQIQSGGNSEGLWISSLDGNIQKKLTDIGTGSHTDWVSNQEIIVSGIPTPPWGLQASIQRIIPITSINPLTGDKQSLSPLPNIGDYHSFEHYFRNDDKPYNLFNVDANAEAFYLYDYTNNSYVPVLQWLTGDDWLTTLKIHTFFWLMPDGTLTITVDSRPYGIDWIPNLNINSLSTNNNYSDQAQKIYTPAQINPPFVLDYSHNLMILTNQPIATSTTLGFDIFDTEAGVIKNYCLDINTYTETSLSPDGHFLALTYYKDLSTVGEAWIIILNLDTGYLAKIDGYRMLGWGKTK